MYKVCILMHLLSVHLFKLLKKLRPDYWKSRNIFIKL